MSILICMFFYVRKKQYFQTEKWSAFDIIILNNVIKKETSKNGLQINTNKTKVMELINSKVDPADSELAYEKVNDFKYLGAILNTKNNW